MEIDLVMVDMALAVELMQEVEHILVQEQEVMVV